MGCDESNNSQLFFSKVHHLEADLSGVEREIILLPVALPSLPDEILFLLPATGPGIFYLRFL